MLQMKVIHVPFALSIGQAVMILFGMTILAGVLESVFVMFLSELFNNSVSAMAIVVGIMLLSQVVTIPQNWRVLYELWNSMPSILLAEWSFLETRLVPFFGAYLTNFQFSAILYLVLTSIFVTIGKRRYQKFQVGGR